MVYTRFGSGRNPTLKTIDVLETRVLRARAWRNPVPGRPRKGKSLIAGFVILRQPSWLLFSENKTKLFRITRNSEDRFPLIIIRMLLVTVIRKPS